MAASERGFVFAATGKGYTDLAGLAAQSLRQVHEGAEIDLFTDLSEAEAPQVFDRVHPLDTRWTYPKYEALLRSRFERTVYLDADTLTIAPVWDLFEILDHFDFAAAHDAAPNGDEGIKVWRRPVPAAFPAVNAGVIAVRRNEATRRFLEACDAAYSVAEDRNDQIVLRELLYESDLRLAILPAAYNSMFVAHLEAQDHNQLAPRILHIPKLHNHLHGYGPQIFTPRQAVGPMIWRHIRTMLAADRALGAKRARPFLPLMDQGPLGRTRRFLHNTLRDWARRSPRP
jgi:hypothetical protein